MLPTTLCQNSAAEFKNELKIPGCNVLVNASHTHPRGPMLCDDAGQVDRTFDAVSRALQNVDAG